MKISNKRKNRRRGFNLLRKNPNLCPHCQNRPFTTSENLLQPKVIPGNHWNPRWRFFECSFSFDIARYPWTRKASIT